MPLGTLLIFVGGLALLMAGTEALVRGASRLAVASGISPLVIGLTVVAYGTSSPAAAVSVQALLSNQADLTLGNVVGSNIFNVLFILGVSVLQAPLVVAQQLVRLDVPLIIGLAVLLLLLSLNGQIGRLDGGLLGRAVQPGREPGGPSATTGVASGGMMPVLAHGLTAGLGFLPRVSSAREAEKGV